MEANGDAALNGKNHLVDYGATGKQQVSARQKPRLFNAVQAESGDRLVALFQQQPAESAQIVERAAAAAQVLVQLFELELN